MEPLLESFWRELSRSRRAVLGLDYDGTLAPFRSRPGDAVPYPGVHGLLAGIMADGRTRVVVISGRPAGDVAVLLALRPAPEIWGVHGWERMRPGAHRECATVGGAEADVLAAARTELASHGLLARSEWKVASVVVHWRDAADAAGVAAKAGAVLAPFALHPGFELLPISEGVELRCRRRHKGTALDTVLSEEVPGVPAAYLGDDQTDEDAFRALAGRGLALRVAHRPAPTTATAHIEPEEGVLEFLERWLHATTVSRDPGATAGRTI